MKYQELLSPCAAEVANPSLVGNYRYPTRVFFPVDVDQDGLIEIRNLDMLNNIRHNLAGTNYKTSGTDPGSSARAPASRPSNCNGRITTTNLCGYELTRNLDFALSADYASGSVNANWRPNNTTNLDLATNVGFNGFGDLTGTAGGFSAIFEGNGHTINNLYSRNRTNTGNNVALFRTLILNGFIRNVGVTNVNLYGGSGNADRVGGLVGQNNSGTIIASHATGTAKGGAGNNDFVGGLVGRNYNGRITANHATVNVDGGNGNSDSVGGLVGLNQNGRITANYATGDVGGGIGTDDDVGGLVGWNSGSLIIASYARGKTDGGDGGGDRTGGLVGNNESNGRIIASYATGDVDGGMGNDWVGRLVGRNPSSAGMITHSYAFGAPSNGTGGHNGTPPSGVTTASRLTEINTPAASWNNAGNDTLGAWNFGTTSQDPALVYADYDGTGNIYGCNRYPLTIPGTSTTLTCGSSLLRGQR